MARPRKERARNAKLMVSVSDEEKAAIMAKAEQEKTSYSAIAYDMLKRGNLESLVRSYRAQRA